MASLSLRIWVLGIVLSLSIISIVNASGSVKLLIFMLLFGVLVVLSLIKSGFGRIIFSLILIAIAAALVINALETGVAIKSIDKDSQAFNEGLRQGQIIKSVNGKEVRSVEEYSGIINSIFASGNESRISVQTKEAEYIWIANTTPEISVSNIPLTNIKTGLDISGGARALVAPKQNISDSDMQDLIAVSQNRFNAFGLSDVNIKSVTDLTGNKFMLVEVAGAAPEDLQSLISEQGKFEAKIGNKTAFTGEEKDITHVFRNDATQAVVYPPEQYSGGGYISRFSFAITLSQEAAQRHADITREIPVDPESGGKYLTENLTLILDGKIMDELRISSGLKGQVTSEVSVQGSGIGSTPEEALKDARRQMNKLQTILISGSLPFDLEIVKLDSISPVLGKEFVKRLLALALVVFLAVSILIFVRYRKFKLSSAVILTMFSEATITLGIAALIGWNLDAPGIAGIIAGMGTGVNDQIVIIDESVSSERQSLKERIKRALFIVLGAFLTIVAAMLPLFWAGAGLLKGFALTTIIGVSGGILITRPAFADILKKMGE